MTMQEFGPWIEQPIPMWWLLVAFGLALFFVLLIKPKEPGFELDKEKGAAMKLRLKPGTMDQLEFRSPQVELSSTEYFEVLYIYRTDYDMGFKPVWYDIDYKGLDVRVYPHQIAEFQEDVAKKPEAGYGIAMKPSREIDKRIAEKVLGQTVVPRASVVGGQPDYWVEQNEGLVAVPQYSTQAACAYELIDDLYKTGKFQFEIRQVSPANDPTRKEYLCLCFAGDGTTALSEAFAPTGPLAICLAALKAVGAKL